MYLGTYSDWNADVIIGYHLPEPSSAPGVFQYTDRHPKEPYIILADRADPPRASEVGISRVIGLQ